MDSMKTLVVDANGKLSVEVVPLPVIGERDALVKTVSCGVCNGTDGKLIHGKFKGFPKDVYPVMLGHEAVGRVIETGSKVKSYKKGDHVFLPFAGPLGGYTSGWGAYSEYAVVTDAEALKADGIMPYSDDFPESAAAQTVVPEWIDPVKAAMIITLREVLSAIKYFGITESDNVAVFGCGPVGLTFIKFMSLLGVKSITALDIVDEKLASAKNEGADLIFNSGDKDLTAKIRAQYPAGMDYVIDAAGASAIINQAMGIIRDRGKICCYGISANTNAEIDWSAAPYNWQLIFQQFPSKHEEGAVTGQVLDWLKSGRIDLDDYISDIIDFGDILTAFEKLENKEISKKCIIRYE